MAQQNVEVKIVGKDQASREILGVGTALDRMKASVETNKAGLNKLDNALKDSAANMLGLQGTAGRLADALLEFAPGGIIGGLAVAGIGLLISGLMTTQEEQDKSTESLEKYLETSSKLEQALNKLRFGEFVGDVKNLKIAFEDVNFSISQAEYKLLQVQNQLKEDEALARILSNQFMGLPNPVGILLSKFVDTREEVEKIKTKAGELNLALAEQANLMTRLQNIGMQQLSGDISRLNTLRELAKVGRLTTAEQKEQEFLTTKLTNLSKEMGATAEVRLMAFKALGIEIVNHQEQQRKLNEATRQQRDLFKQMEESALKRLEAESQAERLRREGMRQAIATDLQKQLEGMGVNIEKQFEGFGVENFETRMQSISQLAYNISDGFDVMTEAIMQGNNAFKSLEMGARAAARNILRSFAQEQIAKGIGAIGSALTATATGNFPSAGLFYQSAAKHFAAAAAAGFAGGAIGGGGSNRGGGVGGGFNNSNLGQVGGQRSPIYITISGGGILDMNNPETARSFVAALGTLTDRRAIITTTGR